jgi:diguanylate cyclase
MFGNKRFLNILLGLVAVINLLIIVALPDSESKVIYSDIGFIAIGIVVLICLWKAARASRTVSRKLAAAWYFLFFAHICFVVADLLWGYYEIILHIVPFPSWADAFYLSNYLIFFIGVIFLVEKNESSIGQFDTWLDIGVVFVSSFLLLWIFLMHPILESVAEETLFVQALTIAYPIGDLLLICALLILIYKRSAYSIPIPLIFLALSLLTEIFTDLVFSYQSLHGSHISGGMTDIGWVAAYWLLGLAASAQTNAADAITKIISSAEKKKSAWHRFYETYRIMMPYLLAVITVVLLQVSYNINIYTNFNFILAGVWSVVLLVFFRQYLALRDNNLLNQNLQTALVQVQERVQLESKVNSRLTSEIKERKKLQKQLKHNALHDPLTGLPNRILFLDRLEHALALSKRTSGYGFSVFFIDLDQFKQVNDNLGHAAGDEALVQFSHRLQKTLRKSDSLARLGGDEFAILVENSCDFDCLKLVAERVHDCSHMTFNVKDREFNISASMGLVNDTRGYDDANQIIKDADLAMYQAKGNENEYLVVFDQKMREQFENRI